jgi:ABC-type transporter Mla MlaB component
MRIMLPERLQASQVEALLGELRGAAASGEALALDGSQVGRVDTAGLQLLVSLAKTRPDFTWAGAAEPLVDAARQLGLSQVLKLAGGSTP